MQLASGRVGPSSMNVKENDQLLPHPHPVQVSINFDANGNCQDYFVEPLNQRKNPSDISIINNPTYSGNKNMCT
ncbi:hypothetical protein WN944_017756 [Citrus x changshan-huyou]|uniref:Uncharacterized protein n=1 Tax=Citrus x changshan-huyou TaxID=2935761 RepID=A0AAP0MI65_9ROSI